MGSESRKRIQLGVDVKQLLTILGTVLYTDREGIIKELIQNANDAIALRVMRDTTFSESQGRISISIDHDRRHFSVADNGIGMTLDELEVLLDTTAASAKQISSVISEAEGKVTAEMVGRYGIGFLSTFALASVVEISTKPWHDESDVVHALVDMNGHVTVSREGGIREAGTIITLHLNSQGEFLLDAAMVRDLVAHHCQFIKFPIALGEELVHTPPSLRTVEDGASFNVHVAEVLRNAGLQFEIEPSVGGLRPDFVVHGPEGQVVVLETKAWSPRPGNFARALAQAEHYKEVTGADAAFVVLANARAGRPREGVVTLNGLVSAIRDKLNERPEKDRQPKPISSRRSAVFAAMPFCAEYDDVFFVAMAYAAEHVNATCVRVDQEEFSGDVVTEIQWLIRNSIAVIADLSESKPNVLYEIGYAHALSKPVVHVCSTSLDELPFDVRNWNTIRYARGQTYELRERLARRLSAIV